MDVSARCIKPNTNDLRFPKGAKVSKAIVGPIASMDTKKPLDGLTSSEKTCVVLFLSLAIVQSLAISNGATALFLYPLARPLYYASWLALLIASVIVMRDPKSRVTPFAVFPIVYWFIITCNSYDGMQIGNVIIATELTVFALASAAIKKSVFLMYRFFLVAVAVGGIVAFTAHGLSLPLGGRSVDFYYAATQGYQYADYGFAYLLTSKWSSMVRLCGIFNEPGLLGTLAALFLCADRFNLRKPGNIALFVAGCMTFSLAFFVIAAIYIFAMCARRPKTIVAMLACVLIAAFVLPNVVPTDSQAYHLLERAGIVKSDVRFDNRTTDELNRRVAEMSNSLAWLVGNGRGSAENLSEDGGNAGLTLSYYEFGLVGVAILFIPPLALSYRQAKGSRDAMVFLLCFAASLYQRADLYTLPLFLTLLGAIELLKVPPSSGDAERACENTLSLGERRLLGDS